MCYPYAGFASYLQHHLYYLVNYLESLIKIATIYSILNIVFVVNFNQIVSIAIQFIIATRLTSRLAN